MIIPRKPDYPLTPGGLPKIGTRIRYNPSLLHIHVADKTPGPVYVIVERTSNSSDYGVWAVREDGTPETDRSRKLLGTFSWMLQHNGWEILP